MKSVKIVLGCMEVAMLLGIIIIVFFEDWELAIEAGKDWMLKLLIVLFALAAVVCQAEQQDIEWDEKEEA